MPSAPATRTPLKPQSTPLARAAVQPVRGEGRRAYTASMAALYLPVDFAQETRSHLANVVDNLQLIADMGYGDVALVWPIGRRARVVADAGPTRRSTPFGSTRVGRALARDDEPEAYLALHGGSPVDGGPRAESPTTSRTRRPRSRSASRSPLRPSFAVSPGIAESVPGAMEKRLHARRRGAAASCSASRPLVDLRTGSRSPRLATAGDGVMHVASTARIAYASPNAVSIMRLAGVGGRVIGMRASALPGGGSASRRYSVARGDRRAGRGRPARARVPRHRLLEYGTLVLVEDVTEACRREREIKVKEATIREVHHRVKNNLQTIASLLRVHARRTTSDETRKALADATERVTSMAVVHDLLAGSDEERVDFAQAARTVVDLVRRGLVGERVARRGHGERRDRTGRRAHRHFAGAHDRRARAQRPRARLRAGRRGQRRGRAAQRSQTSSSSP